MGYLLALLIGLAGYFAVRRWAPPPDPAVKGWRGNIRLLLYLGVAVLTLLLILSAAGVCGVAVPGLTRDPLLNR